MSAFILYFDYIKKLVYNETENNMPKKIVLLNIIILFVILSGSIYSGERDMNKNKPMNAEVKNFKGRPTIFINDNPYSPMFYALTDQPGDRWSTDDIPQLNIKLFADLGVRLFQLDIPMDYIWMEDGSISLERAKKQVQGVLAVCPDAAIFFRLHVNAPKWWIKKHSEENVKYDKFESKPDPVPADRQMIYHDAGLAERFSLASKKWIESSTEKVKQFCKEFSQTEEGNHLAGIQVACGIYGEWHYWGLLYWEVDFSEPMRLHFTEWLKTKYNRVENLKKAWNDPNINFETISIPTTEERDKTSAGIFRDPKRDQKVIDYYTCQHELVGNDVLHFCKTVKESWPRPIITGSFYGYFFSVFNRLAAGSQLDLEQVLKSKYIDYLCGPQAYEPEAYLAGEPYRSRGLITSALLNGKLWLDEMDQSPYRTLQYGNRDSDNEKYEYLISENVSIITRNTMFPHSKGMGLWFYDFGPSGFYTHPEKDKFPSYCLTGYWDHPRYLECIKKLKNIYDRQLDEEYKTEADVLLVYDTKTQYNLKSIGEGDPVTAQIIDWMSLNTFYSGVVFDPVHICDLDKIDYSKYKIVVFGNTFVMDNKTKEIIKNKIAKDSRQLLWIYAPAYSNGETISDEFVSDITEMNLKNTACKEVPKVLISKSIGVIPDQHPNGLCSPLFSIDDSSVIVYGNYEHDKSPAFAKKEFSDHTSWFIGVPPTDYRLLKFIYKSAGANIYNDDKDIFYGGSGIITMHTKTGGKKIIHLKNGKNINLDLPFTPSTILIDSNTGKVIYEGR
jgi:hypothetical protein